MMGKEMEVLTGADVVVIFHEPVVECFRHLDWSLALPGPLLQIFFLVTDISEEGCGKCWA